VLVAVENKSIVGVRAFMRWNWQKEDKIYSALRAVDTATHPDHQGKGIFKKLTLKALEVVEEQGDHFIFNTPNSQSLPGYLKMGWESVGKLFVRLTPVNPLQRLNRKVSLRNFESSLDYEKLEMLLSDYNKRHKEEGNFYTHKSTDYLSWSYSNKPMQKYLVKGDKDFFLAAYVKSHKHFSELRIAEHVFINKEGLKKIKAVVKELSREFSVHLISSSGGLKISKFYISGNYGPVFTVRNVNLDPEVFKEAMITDSWSYKLGDLELF
jgi:GNAT superfamily N-acetyltransferase